MILREESEYHIPRSSANRVLSVRFEIDLMMSLKYKLSNVWGQTAYLWEASINRKIT